MSLNWKWSDKCGHLTISQRIDETNERELTYTLYQGNAYLIALHEFKQDNKDMYEMGWFFCDKQHMNRCLGLVKDSENIFDNGRTTLKELVLKQEMNSYSQQIAKAFRKAFPVKDDNTGLRILIEY